MKFTEENYVEIAEGVIKNLCKDTDKKGNQVNLVTTSKIRNLLSMTSEIYNEVINSQEEKLSSDIVERINYLKIRFIYESGREPLVRKLVEEAKILEIISAIKGSRKNYILFSRYMEALVAYRKFYGKRDE